MEDYRKTYKVNDRIWKVTKQHSSPECQIQQVRVTHVSRDTVHFDDTLTLNAAGDVVRQQNFGCVVDGVFYVLEFSACEVLVDHGGNFHRMEVLMRDATVKNMHPDTVSQILLLLDNDALFKSRRTPEYNPSEDDS